MPARLRPEYFCRNRRSAPLPRRSATGDIGPAEHRSDPDDGALRFAEIDHEISSALPEGGPRDPGGHNRTPRFGTGGRNARPRYYVDLPEKPGLEASSPGQGTASGFAAESAFARQKE